jgi:hypothetical protein
MQTPDFVQQKVFFAGPAEVTLMAKSVTFQKGKALLRAACINRSEEAASSLLSKYTTLSFLPKLRSRAKA